MPAASARRAPDRSTARRRRRSPPAGRCVFDSGRRRRSFVGPREPEAAGQIDRAALHGPVSGIDDILPGERVLAGYAAVAAAAAGDRRRDAASGGQRFGGEGAEDAVAAAVGPHRPPLAAVVAVVEPDRFAAEATGQAAAGAEDDRAREPDQRRGAAVLDRQRVAAAG